MTRILANSLCVLVLSLSVPACEAGGAAAPAEVIITHGSMSTTSIPLWVAEDQGLFPKHGIKAKVVLGRCDQVRLPSVGMTVVVERAYLQQNSETLQDILKALIESTVFISNPKNKAAVLGTIMKRFKITDPAAAEGVYQDVLALVRLEEYRKPYVSIEGLRILQRLMKNQNPRVADIKAENLVEMAVVRKLDESGFFDRLYNEYGVK